MKTVREKRLFEKLKNKKNRIHHLKGIGEIVLPKIYSFKQKRNTIDLLCGGEKTHSFPKDVTVQTIKDAVSRHKVLKNYCGATTDICQQSENCSECHSLHKGWAEERKEKGEKIVRPNPEDISEERTSLSPIRSKKYLFRRSYSGKW